jgi:hypothetical protein
LSIGGHGGGHGGGQHGLGAHGFGQHGFGGHGFGQQGSLSQQHDAIMKETAAKANSEANDFINTPSVIG